MDQQQYVLAQVPSAPGARLHFSWGLGNEIFCCGTASSANEISPVSCVQWGVLPAPQRRISYDIAAKFVELQRELAQTSRGGLVQPQHHWAAILSFSKAVSAILDTTGCSTEGGAVEIDQEGLEVAKERALWDLACLFALEASASIPDLPRWLRSNAVALSDGAAASPLPRAFFAEMQQVALPEAHPAYFLALCRLVALGWLAEALELLGMHSAWLQWDGHGGDPEVDAQVAVLEAATLLLRRMPSVKGRGASAGATAREFDSLQECLAYRVAWQGQCRTLLADAALWDHCTAVSPETSAAVKQIVQILSGDDVAVVSTAANWAELLVARLLHVRPEASSLAALRQLLHDCLQTAPPSNQYHDVLAAMIESACDADLQTAMRACSELTSDRFLAHAPLIMAAHPAGEGTLRRELPHLGATQGEFYLLDYAAALAPHAPTWALAAAYFAWCPAHGRAAFQALVERLPLNAADGGTALRAAELCEDQGLLGLAAEVLRAQGVMSWQRGLLSAALTWLVRIPDLERVDVVLQPLVRAAWSGGESESDSNNPAAAAALEALEALPPGSAHHAMLRVNELLSGNGTAAASAPAGNSSSKLDAAVELLATLPRKQRQRCLGAVWGVIGTANASQVSKIAVMQLLQWLEEESAAEGRDAAQAAVARLVLVRLLVRMVRGVPAAAASAF